MKKFIVLTLVFGVFIVPGAALTKPNPEKELPKLVEVYTVCLDQQQSAVPGESVAELTAARSECVDIISKTTYPNGNPRFTRGILKPIDCISTACDKTCEEGEVIYGCYGARPL